MKRYNGPEARPTTSNAARLYGTPQLFKYGSLADITASGFGSKGEHKIYIKGNSGFYECIPSYGMSNCRL